MNNQNLNLFHDGIYEEETIVGVNSTNQTKEAFKFFNSLVLVCHRISVWTGTTTEQISVDDGSESLIRKKIVPGELLKPFLDLRNKAKRICARHGQPYLNGFVMPADCARMTLDELKVLRAAFIRQRDEIFAHQYEKLKEDRKLGIIPRSCSELDSVPSLRYVLGHISFNYDAFALASFRRGPNSSYESFMTDFCQRMANDAEDTKRLLESSSEIPDALLFRCLEQSEKLDTWRRVHPDIGKAAVRLKGAYIVTNQRPKAIQTPEKLIDALDSIIRLGGIDFFCEGLPCFEKDTQNGAVQVDVHAADNAFSPPPSEDTAVTIRYLREAGDRLDESPTLTSDEVSQLSAIEDSSSEDGQPSDSLEEEEQGRKWTCSMDSVLARKRTVLIG